MRCMDPGKGVRGVYTNKEGISSTQDLVEGLHSRVARRADHVC